MNALSVPMRDGALYQLPLRRTCLFDEYLDELMPLLQDWLCSGWVCRVKIDFRAERLICRSYEGSARDYVAVGEEVFGAAGFSWPASASNCEALDTHAAEAVTAALEMVIRLRLAADGTCLDVAWLDADQRRLGLRFSAGRSQIVEWDDCKVEPAPPRR